MLRSLFDIPPPEEATEEGLVAIGGDLHPERLLRAYREGIFPWYNVGEPILWWSPDPRMVLEPGQLHVQKSLRPVLRRPSVKVTYNRCFSEVMTACGDIPRPGQDGTWITEEMLEAYEQLHELGWAHSVETWYDGELVGGLYGIAMGKFFFGESMFSRQSDASKVALVRLCQRLQEEQFELIDCQVATPHLHRMGAREVPRAEFLQRLRGGLAGDDRPLRLD